MILVILVLAAAGIAAYIHRDKLKAIFDRADVQKPATFTDREQPAKAEQPVSSNPNFQRILDAIEFLKPRIVPPDVLDLDKIQRRLGFGLNTEEVAFAISNGVYVKPDVAPVVVDRSGNDLSDGAPRTFVLADGQPQLVTFNRAGKVRVFGISGTQLRSVTDWETRTLAGTIAEYERSFDGPGSYTFSVTSSGGNVAARLL